MPSLGAITKTIRLSPEDREIVEEIMRSEDLTWSGAIHKLISEKGTPQNVSQKNTKIENEGTPHRQDLMDRAVEREIGSMCRLSGISTHDFYRGVCELWESGKLEVEGDKVKSLGKYNVKKFEEVCYRAHVLPQKMIDKLTESLEKNV